MLRKAGHRVVTSDLVAHAGADPGIESRIDFLLEWRAPEGCTCIVTNPPFKLADEFIRHGLTLVEKVIVLLRLMASEGPIEAIPSIVTLSASGPKSSGSRCCIATDGPGRKSRAQGRRSHGSSSRLKDARPALPGGRNGSHGGSHR